MKSHIIVGLGFGDEGKGLVTDLLTSHSENPLVIRSTGGHQAGHTVVLKGKKHVFASFGSGTMRGVPTYWSKYCTFSPTNLIIEYELLMKIGVTPKLYVDSLCPVTTPFDQYANTNDRATIAHGTCGLGIGKTIERTQGPAKLYVQDLLTPTILRERLKAVKAYYGYTTENDVVKEITEVFMEMCRRVMKLVNVVHEQTFFNSKRHVYSDYIFEGSQGILLDMDFGFFPHVTRGNTTSRNPLRIVHRNGLPTAQVYYVTRAYQTRHGNGPMTNSELPLNIIENPNESNVENDWQGKFRRSLLDADLLNYALICDKNFTGNLHKNIVVTCMDQIDGDLMFTSGDAMHEGLSKLVDELAVVIENVYFSNGPSSEDVRILTERTTEEIVE